MCQQIRPTNVPAANDAANGLSNSTTSSASGGGQFHKGSESLNQRDKERERSREVERGRERSREVERERLREREVEKEEETNAYARTPTDTPWSRSR